MSLPFKARSSSLFLHRSLTAHHQASRILSVATSNQPHQALPTSIRTLTTSTVSRFPRKDSQDKDSMNTDATEYSKSGTDDRAAGEQEAAFDPNLTSPESQHEKAGEGQGASSNPLEVSPANREVSKQRPAQEGGPQNSSGSAGTTSARERNSGGGSPSKGKKVA